jgi:hypothetical protein
MISSMEPILTSIGIQSESIVIIVEMLTQMQGGSNSATVSCTLPMLPIILIDALVIIANTQIGNLQIHVIPKIVPLVIYLRLE